MGTKDDEGKQPQKAFSLPLAFLGMLCGGQQREGELYGIAGGERGFAAGDLDDISEHPRGGRDIGDEPTLEGQQGIVGGGGLASRTRGDEGFGSFLGDGRRRHLEGVKCGDFLAKPSAFFIDRGFEHGGRLYPGGACPQDGTASTIAGEKVDDIFGRRRVDVRAKGRIEDGIQGEFLPL